MSAIESVEEANVFQIFTYLSWKASQAEYESEYQKIAHKQARQKGKQ